MAAPLDVLLWRGGSNGRYQIYEVPRRESQTVLDVVTWVQRHLDATLSYRFACRVGMCGSCAMTVNGRPRWTCRTHVSKVAEGGRLTIGLLANLPVIKDLAVDMTAFFAKWQAQTACSRPRRRGPHRLRVLRLGKHRAGRPMRRSSASIAQSAMRPATPCAGIPLTLDRLRSTAPGPSSTMNAMPGMRSALR